MRQMNNMKAMLKITMSKKIKYLNFVQISQHSNNYNNKK